MSLPITLLGSKTKCKSGFMLMEILVVLSVLFFIFGFGFSNDEKSYQREILSTEMNTVMVLLQQSRLQALNNVGATPHGLFLKDPDYYVLFQGGSYDSNSNKNEKFTKTKGVNIILSTDQIIFSNITGMSSYDGEIEISDGVKSKRIKIYTSGLLEML